MATRRGILGMLAAAPVAAPAAMEAAMEGSAVAEAGWTRNTVRAALSPVSNFNARATVVAAYKAGVIDKATMLRAVEDWDGRALVRLELDPDIEAMRSLSGVAKQHMQRQRIADRRIGDWLHREENFTYGLAKRLAGISE
jgi:hypothetical protein